MIMFVLLGVAEVSTTMTDESDLHTWLISLRLSVLFTKTYQSRSNIFMHIIYKLLILVYSTKYTFCICCSLSAESIEFATLFNELI